MRDSLAGKDIQTKRVIVASVYKAEKGIGGHHTVRTWFGSFSVPESCEGLASLKPGVMAIFHVAMKDPPRRHYLPATWHVNKIVPHPNSEQIYNALAFH